MTIEIQSPNLRVRKKTIENIKEKISSLSHMGEQVSRAEVYLTESTELPEKTKTCKIRLSIFGDDLFVSKNADSFGVAASSAIDVLKRALRKKKEMRNTPPEEITSTVDV